MNKFPCNWGRRDRGRSPETNRSNSIRLGSVGGGADLLTQPLSGRCTSHSTNEPRRPFTQTQDLSLWSLSRKDGDL